jgi:type II secretory pathway component PulK
MTTMQTQAGSVRKPAKRRAVVLIAVLVVVVLLSLAGYQYLDMMTSEYKASHNAHRVVQARGFADSGIHYAAAMLADPENYVNELGSNPWSNPALFQDVSIQGDNGLMGKFSLIAPPDPEDGDSSQNLFGVSDESAKFNLNALMKLDPSGEAAYNVLMKLPNMTEDIADAIIDWMDPDSEVRTAGAENDQYTGLGYRCKNGPLDSVDELLLVRGVTPALLYGSDLNRNGILDANESDEGGFVRGWSAYLTVHSREQNYDSQGNLYLNLNNKDVNQLVEKLNEALGEENADVVKFLVMYRQYGPYSATGGTQSLGSAIASLLTGGSSSSSAKIVEGSLESYETNLKKSAKYTMPSIFELVDAKVGISKGSGKNKTITVYESPLTDTTVRQAVLPKLLTMCSLVEDQEIPARVNVSTAPREVLLAIPDITEEDVEKIIAARPRLSSGETPEDAFTTAAWLSTEADVASDVLKKIEKYVTGRTQVYRVQSVGSFDGKGPTIRVEAVIDTNGGRPRILAWRDLSELGKGMNEKTP